MVYFGSYSTNGHDPLMDDRQLIFLIKRGGALVVKFIQGVGFASIKVHNSTTSPTEDEGILLDGG